MDARIIAFAFLLILIFKSAESNDYDGCNTLVSSDGHTFVQDLVYGCDASWEQRGMDNDETETICAAGYHVCGKEKEGQEFIDIWGLDYDTCVTQSLPTDTFYATNMMSEDGETCGDDGSRKVFGCGNPDTTWLFEDASDCGYGHIYSYTDNIFMYVDLHKIVRLD